MRGIERDLLSSRKTREMRGRTDHRVTPERKHVNGRTTTPTTTSSSHASYAEETTARLFPPGPTVVDRRYGARLLHRRRYRSIARLSSSHGVSCPTHDSNGILSPRINGRFASLTSLSLISGCIAPICRSHGAPLPRRLCRKRHVCFPVRFREDYPDLL